MEASFKLTLLSQTWWHMSVSPAAGEAEAGEVQLCETLTQKFKKV